MKLEIYNPASVQRFKEHIGSVYFRDADEVFEKALNVLDHEASAAAPVMATGAVLLEALQARSYPDVDLTPLRAPVLTLFKYIESGYSLN